MADEPEATDVLSQVLGEFQPGMPLAFNEGKLLEVLASRLPDYMEQPDIQMLLDELRTELYRGIGQHDTAQILHSIVKNCRKCPNMAEPQLPYWNVVDPDIVIVADSPNISTDGQSLLVKTLKDAGFNSGRLCLTFVNRCKPQEHRKHVPEEILNCLPYLHTEIQILKPKLVLALGLVSTSTLLGAQVQLGNERGKIHWLGPWAILPTYTPGYILAGADHLQSTFENDIKTVYDFVYGN